MRSFRRDAMNQKKKIAAASISLRNTSRGQGEKPSSTSRNWSAKKNDTSAKSNGASDRSMSWRIRRAAGMTTMMEEMDQKSRGA